MLVVRTFLWAFTGDAISKVAILATSLIAARALTPVEFGLYLGLSATTIIATAFWDAGVGIVVTRELAAKHLTARQAITQTAALRVRTLPIWAVAFAGGAAILARQTDVSVAPLAAFGAASLTIGTQGLVFPLLHASLRFKEAAASLALGRWVTALVSLVALPLVGVNDALFILALALFAGEAVTVVAASSAVVLRRRSADWDLAGTSAPSSKVTLRKALPFAANSVLNLAYNRFDVVILAALSSPFQLALYAPASRLQDALYLIPGTIAAIGLPLVARGWEGGAGLKATRTLLTRLMALGMALSLPTAIFVFVYAEDVLTLVLGDEYGGAARATRILIWSLPFACLTATLIVALAGTDRAMDTTRVFVVAFGVALTLHLSLDWWWGATGAAVASFAREPAALLTAVIYARRAGLIGLRPSQSSGRAAPSGASPSES
jgi:O-antigen/teichoic acid export membrane protein